MTKRYGRNQKRKAREEIENLRAALKRDGKLLAYTTDRNRDLQGVIDNARRILPRYCVALPPELMDMPHDSRCAPQQFRVSELGSVEQRIYELNIMLQHADIDRMTGALHLRLRYRNDVLAYSATEEAIRDIPPKELARIVADNVAHAVVTTLKESK